VAPQNARSRGVPTRAQLAAVWLHDPQPFARKNDLEVLLSDLRRRLRAVSGKITFLQTVRGHGLRLIV
jgi:DNA-binding winged helix-turn-helix (wHTH) protein